MKVNSLVAALAALIVVSPLYAGTDPAPRKFLTPEERKARAEAFQKLSPAERERVIAERKAKIERRAGGKVRNTSVQKGRVLVLNAQKKADAAKLREAIDKLANHLRIEIAFEEADKADPEATKAVLAEKKANAVIYVGECDKSGPLLIAPDDLWAYVNVKALGDRNLDDRAKKELARAFIFLCGGIASQYQNPLTRAVTDVRNLDLIPVTEIPVDVLGRMPPYLETMGVTPYVEATYRSACHAGWAPQPTNDVQRAIWNEVHEIPSEPIRIQKK